MSGTENEAVEAVEAEDQVTVETDADGEGPPPATLDIHLDPPITFQKGTYSVLHLREPRAREVRQAEAILKPGGGLDGLRRYQIMLVAAVTGLPVPVVEALPISRLIAASDYLQRFLDGGQRPKTGTRSAPS